MEIKNQLSVTRGEGDRGNGRKKELLPFTTAWMELGSIMLSEISQEVKDKYHMISPISGTYATKQTREQNRIRDMEIKNKLTVTRGDGNNWGKKGKGHVKEHV